MINDLELDGFRGAESRVRCFPHILNLSVKVMWLNFFPHSYPFFRYSHSTQAILSQFANKLEDNDAPKSRKRKHQARTTQGTRKTAAANGAQSDNSDDGDSDGNDVDDDDDDDDNDDNDNDYMSDGEQYNGNNDTNPDSLDTLDQDEDVIRAAEESQQSDLEEAAATAESRVPVTESEQKAASTALTKVSSATVTLNYVESLLTACNSSPNSHTRSTTLLAFLKNWRRCVPTPILTFCT